MPSPLTGTSVLVKFGGGLNTSNGSFDSPKLMLFKFPYPQIFLNVFPIGIYACIPLNKLERYFKLGLHS